MFDDELRKIPTEAPRSPALLQGLKWRSVFLNTTLLTPLAVVASFFSLFVILGISTSWQFRHFIGAASYIDAKVTDVIDGGRLGEIEILYRFRAGDGREYPGRALVNRDSSPHARTKPLEPIPVQFNKSHPWENSIVKDSHHESYFVLLLFPIFFVACFLAPVLAARLLRVSRDRRLFRRGNIVKGAVTFIKPGAMFMWWGWSGASTAEVFVSYPGDSGAQLEARALCQNDWLIHHLAPGTPVHISYLPRRPTRAMLLDAYVR